ncbi:MAG: dihydrodipicolinate synthase family protein [Desulfobacterales bacterium]|nr:dihydrodipicolinate synthase family protein [Desulfobacterales bacterium]
MAKKQIKGVIPPMITPFKKNGDVDYDKHIQNMESWNKDKLAGFLVLGSNSETAYLNEAEKIKLIKLTVKHAKKGRMILAGTGVESARETIALTNKAADLGVDAALVLTPAYYHAKMNEEAQINFFTEVADHTKIPVMIYNVTAFTHINVTVNTVKVLSKHPNILGMKDSTGNVPQLVAFSSVIDKGFNLMTGTLSAWYPALTLGVKAGIFAVANCTPNECSAIQTAFDKGDYDAARALYFRIFPVNNTVTATFGIAGLKYASDLLGYQGGHVRSPLLPIKEEEKNKIKEILKTAQLI